MNFFNNIDISFRLVLFYIFFGIVPACVFIIYGVNFYSIVFFAVMVFLGALFLYFLKNSFTSPIGKLIEGLEENIQREKDFLPLELKNFSDEFYRLFSTYNRFIKKLSHYQKNMIGKTEVSLLTSKKKEKEKKYYEFLYKATRIMLLVNDSRELVKSIIQLSSELFPAQLIFFERWEKEKEIFVIEEIINFSQDHHNILGEITLKQKRIPLKDSFGGYLYNKKSYLTSQEVAIREKFVDFAEIAAIIKLYEMEVENFIGIPLIFRDEFLGNIIFINSQQEIFSQLSKKFMPSIFELFAYSLKRQEVIDKYLIDLQTGLYTVSYFKQRLAEELEFSRRVDSKGSAILIGFDEDFSNNPNYLYAFSERLAILVKEESRFVDIPTMLTPQKIAVLLPETALRGGMIYAARIREMVEDTQFVSPQDEIPMKITVSIGLVDLQKKSNDNKKIEEVMVELEEALKVAQKNGGNRIFAL